MTGISKVKLCWNCEGRLDFNEENCPYCGVYVSPIEGSGADALAPPYQLGGEEEQKAPPAPYRTEQYEEERQQPKIAAAAKAVDQKELQKQAAAEGISLVLTPMTLLIGGTLFLFFSLALLLFSQDGVFTLKWNASHWYLYFATALAMLFFGWKTLHKIDEGQ